MNRVNKIGVFDSGYGGLTILKSIVEKLPNYQYVYLGDNARAPYGNKSFDLIYEYTLEAVCFLFEQGCELVILACNTASAKALRTIQQKDLPQMDSQKRVLGVIRPSTEEIGRLTKTKVIGVLGTEGTISSESYVIELKKTSPTVVVVQHACPLWVPLIESNQHQTEAGSLIIQSDLDALMAKNKQIDTIILACTHYPIILDEIKSYLGEQIQVFPQGPLVADKLSHYLQRHPALEGKLSNERTVDFFTTENKAYFDSHASIIFGKNVNSIHIQLNSQPHKSQTSHGNHQ
jgi:glutamate racemase